MNKPAIPALFLRIFALGLYACNAENFSGASKSDRNPTESNTEEAICGGGNLVCGDEQGTSKDPIEELITDKSPTVPQFAMLVNDPTCAFCHMTIDGDIASTRLVYPVWQSSALTVIGTWYAALGFEANNPTFFNGSLPSDHPQAHKARVTVANFGNSVALSIQGGIKKDLKVDNKLPNDLDKDGIADFPLLNMSELAKNMNGEIITPDGNTIPKIHNDNLVLVGTKERPIQIKGEILVKGDLVIKGYYSGIGNIYAEGNIYIPADLIALNSAFPYPENQAAALDAAKKAIQEKKDALALATPKSILIGDLESYSLPNAVSPTDFSPFDSNHWAVPADRDYEALGVKGVYNWMAKNEYESLYEDNKIFCDNTHPQNHRSFGLVEAFLYAGNTIGGWANHSSYAINGGVIADHFHIIAAAPDCPDEPHPVHGLNAKSNYINFDFRMQAGLQLLKQLSPYFEKPVTE